MDMKVVALAGGVGGAKLVDGLARILKADNFTVVVNTGDDFDHLGLRICPDMDTVCYTLAGIANPDTGWGRIDETWNALASLDELGGPNWFRIGDRDLGTHLERTRLLAKGYSLSEVTANFCRSWGIKPNVLPMSNNPVPTRVFTDQGEMAFQEYFVQHACQPRVSGFAFTGVETAQPAPGVVESIREAELLVICPSNPWVSIDPILAVPGIKEAILTDSKLNQVIAVSPIIGGQAVKGPAAKMFQELGLQPSALSIAKHYGTQLSSGLLTAFVFDEHDAEQDSKIVGLGFETLVTNTLMKSPDDRIHLAGEVITFGGRLNGG
jgi:LPPG:FO 2-phospho-L-lactate transferase